MPTTQVFDRHSCIGFLQKTDDLFFRKSLLHVQSPWFWDWTLKSGATQIWEDVATIEENPTLTIPRWVLIKIAGNLSKHNFLRAVRVAQELVQILDQAGVHIDLEQALLVQNDIYEHFHVDVLEYHSSTIAEFLNNLRWAIQKYLYPEFARSYTKDNADDTRYRFNYPAELTNSFSKTCYWDLMNRMRDGPYMKPFTVTRHLKGKY